MRLGNAPSVALIGIHVRATFESLVLLHAEDLMFCSRFLFAVPERAHEQASLP
jgi:hypothetical protein